MRPLESSARDLRHERKYSREESRNGQVLPMHWQTNGGSMVQMWSYRKRLIRACVLASTASCAAASPAVAGNGSVTFTYDAVGRVTSAVYDTGVTLQYSYDAA